METNIQNTVSDYKTISPQIFENLVNSLECDSRECWGEVSFEGTYQDESHLQTDCYHLNIWGEYPQYKAQIEPNASYMVVRHLFDGETRYKLSFSPEQMKKLQAIIDAKVIEVLPEQEKEFDYIDFERETGTVPAMFI